MDDNTNNAKGNHQSMMDSSSDREVSSMATITEEEAACLTVAMRPILDILVPSTNNDSGGGNRHGDEQELVAYFFDNKITTMEALVECSCNGWHGQEDLWNDIQTVANNIKFYGLASFLSRISNVKDRITRALAKETGEGASKDAVASEILYELGLFNSVYQNDQGEDDESKKLGNYLNWLPADLDNLSLQKARKCLRRIFREIGPYDFIHTCFPREHYKRHFMCGKGALPILQAHPQLATEQFACNIGRWHPFIILLFCGFRSCDVRRVYDYFPVPSQSVFRASVEFLSNNQGRFRGRMNPSVMLPYYIFEMLLEIDPLVAQERDTSFDRREHEGPLLLEQFALYGYPPEYLKRLPKLLPENIDTFRVRASTFFNSHGQLSWEGDECRVAWLQKLEKLTRLDYFPPKWTKEGFLKMASLLADSEICTRLERVSISVPTELLYDDPGTMLPALKQLILNKPASLKRLAIHASRYFEAAEELFVQGVADALRTMKNHTGWTLDELQVKLYATTGNSILAQDMFGTIAIKNEFCSRPLHLETPNSSSSDAPVGMLEIICGNIDRHCRTTWDSVSKLKKVGNIIVSPGSNFEVQTVLTAVSAMTVLTELWIIAPVHGSLEDFTAGFTAILDQTTTLQVLHIEGTRKTSLYAFALDGPLYEIETASLCRSLQRNASLKILRLLGVYFKLLPETTVEGHFFNLLDKSNNTTLHCLELCDRDHYFTTMYQSPWKQQNDYRKYTYNNFAETQNIQYLLSLNASGRGKARNKNTTVGELVDLLDKTIDKDTEQLARFRMVDLELPQPIDNNATQTSSGLWSNDPVAENVSIVYDLLRESLSLWIHPIGSGSRSRYTRSRYKRPRIE